MRSNTGGSGWDFTPVINLIDSLYNHNVDSTSSKGLVEVVSNVEVPPSSTPYTADSASTKLGNFDKLWQFLGQPLEQPSPIDEADLSPPEEIDEGVGLSCSDELSDSHGVRWRDEVKGACFETNTERTQNIVEVLTKKQRKALAKQKRKELRAALPRDAPHPHSTSEIESEAELLHSPARKASRHAIDIPKRKGFTSATLHYASSPPSSPSPPKAGPVTSPLKTWPISNPFVHRSFFDVLHIEPFLPRSAAQRKADLTLALINKYPVERKYLLKPAGPSGHAKVSDNGVHVFVDASNIMIGFHDELKRARNIPVANRIRRVPLSFHSLALIMERGRPTAKRVLVGSTPIIPPYEEAKQIGYETCILDKVHKAKELTERQRKYNGGASGHSSGSGSETNGNPASGIGTVMLGPEKWTEQAVDEILHLKILESLVDAKEPSTIVLATGDAAVAEYSAGFMRMVERALEKGWKVELVTWSKNMSYLYRKREFRQKWGTMFKVVELDDFAEELLAM